MHHAATTAKLLVVSMLVLKMGWNEIC